MPIREILIFSIFLTTFVNGQAQELWPINNDSLIFSLDKLLEKKSLDENQKEYHFLSENYFEAIYSTEFGEDFERVMRKIDLPVAPSMLWKVKVVACYDLTEAYSTWFVTLVDTSRQHHIYFYQSNSGVEKVYLSGVVKEVDFIGRCADHLMGRFSDKNEDYIVTAEIEDGKFISFFGSQTYHRLDLVFLTDVLQLIRLKNCD